MSDSSNNLDVETEPPDRRLADDPFFENIVGTLEETTEAPPAWIDLWVGSPGGNEARQILDAATIIGVAYVEMRDVRERNIRTITYDQDGSERVHVQPGVWGEMTQATAEKSARQPDLYETRPSGVVVTGLMLDSGKDVSLRRRFGSAQELWDWVGNGFVEPA